jgi:succinate dehydrogenase assembly factor 2
MHSRDVELRHRYDHVPEVYPESSFASADQQLQVDDIRRKRLIYRSKQRGWLEVDLLLGSWATRFVPELTSPQLDEYERILNRETLDVFNMVTGKDAVPEELAGEVMDMLQSYAASSPLGKASVEGYAKIKPMMSN